MPGKGNDAGGKGWIIGTLVRSTPATGRVAVQRRFAIVAQSRGEGTLIAGGGLEVVDRPVPARAFDGPGSSLGLRSERGQGRSGGGAFAFRGIAPFGARPAPHLSVGDGLGSPGPF